MFNTGWFWHWALWVLLFHMPSAFLAKESRKKPQHMKYIPQKFVPTRFAASTAQDNCSENGRAKFCRPELKNIVQGRKIQATQTCGENGKTERICSRDDSSWHCETCDSSNSTQTHPTSYLNDPDHANMSDQTCWHSGRIIDPAVEIHDQSKLMALPTKNVSIEIDFKHLYEISFVHIKFCGLMPDSIVIYKSINTNDEPPHWQPYQYYSSDCKGQFGIPTDKAISKLKEDEALCSEKENKPSSYDHETSLTFNVGFGRPSTTTDEYNPVLLNWKTAGAIKIELIRPAIWPLVTGGFSNATIDAYEYSIADIKIGGSCQCNGHADSCIIKDGKPVCQCRHGTEGETCNKCMAFFHDRPWQRGTEKNPNDCIRCNCNLHARKCKFDNKKFDANKKSGGVCHRCRHNTTGDNCQLCVTGYTPDKNRKLTDRKYCKECSCHPIGSIGEICNQTTGACPCKEGVTGRTCSRCAKGYIQSDSRDVPCILKIKTPCKYPKDPECPMKCTNKCPTAKNSKNSIQLSVPRFCKMGFVMRAEIKRKETVDDYVIFEADIKRIYRPSKSGGQSRSKHFVFRSREKLKTRSDRRTERSRKKNEKPEKGSRKKSPKLKTGMGKIWVKKQEDKCGCPKLRPKKTYLIMGRHKRIGRKQIEKVFHHRGKDLNFGIDKKTIVMKWRDEFDHKLVVIKRKAKKECNSKTT